MIEGQRIPTERVTDMNCRYVTFFVAFVFACFTDGLALEARQTQDLEAAVAQHYPQTLVEEALELRGVEPARNQCFATLETSPTGAPQVLVAGYTNMVSGAVRLLRASGSGFEVVAEATTEDLTGWECDVEALDVNNDGRKEAVVHFLTRNTSEDWVFGWDGQQLSHLSPTTTDDLGQIRTGLIDASFADIDGDHILEAVTSSLPTSEGRQAPAELYRLAGSSYMLERPIVGMRSFKRESGSPQTVVGTILLPVGAVGPFTLRVVNGVGPSGSGNRVENAVESGRVWWNGQEIVSPNNFGNNVAVIERTVTLQAENELKVRLAGSPGGRIVILINAANWTP